MADVAAEDRAFWAWDQYWRDGRLASCGGEGGTAYQAAITGGWREFFRTLPTGSCILDVCTGNGAIACVAEETAQERGISFNIEAFDGAVIAASETVGGMIRFRSRVRAESLPYPDDSFNAVVSQYGFEYTHIEKSLPELARVALANCRLRLMIHAQEGIVVDHARRQLEEAERLLRSAIFQTARGLAEQRESRTIEQTRTLKERYNESVRELERLAAGSYEPEMYSNICRVLTHALSIQPHVGTKLVLEKIEEVSETVRAHAQRLLAMTQAGFNRTEVKALAKRIRELWRQEVCVSSCRRADGSLLGWIVELI